MLYGATAHNQYLSSVAHVANGLLSLCAAAAAGAAVPGDCALCGHPAGWHQV
jgi:hypothetical protein